MKNLADLMINMEKNDLFRKNMKISSLLKNNKIINNQISLGNNEFE